MKVAAIAAGVMIAGSAVAAVPGADGVISGCRVLSSGALRVIDAEADQECRTGEQPLDWNQQGVPGATGETGAPGPSGVSKAHVGAQGHGDVVTIGPSITLTVPAGNYIVQGHGQVQGFRGEGSLTSTARGLSSTRSPCSATPASTGRPPSKCSARTTV